MHGAINDLSCHIAGERENLNTPSWLIYSLPTATVRIGVAELAMTKVTEHTHTHGCNYLSMSSIDEINVTYVTLLLICKAITEFKCLNQVL